MMEEMKTKKNSFLAVGMLFAKGLYFFQVKGYVVGTLKSHMASFYFLRLSIFLCWLSLFFF